MPVVYLMRHGIAQEREVGLSDFDRELTSEGIDRMQKEARGLERMGVELGLVLSSPLLRARQTAEIVGKRLGLRVELCDALGDEFDAEALFARLAEADLARGVLLVGHEPDLSHLVSMMIGLSSPGSLDFGKGAVACVELPSLQSPSQGRLLWMMSGKQLAKMGK